MVKLQGIQEEKGLQLRELNAIKLETILAPACVYL